MSWMIDSTKNVLDLIPSRDALEVMGEVIEFLDRGGQLGGMGRLDDWLSAVVTDSSLVEAAADLVGSRGASSLRRLLGTIEEDRIPQLLQLGCRVASLGTDQCPDSSRQLTWTILDQEDTGSARSHVREDLTLALTGSIAPSLNLELIEGGDLPQAPSGVTPSDRNKLFVSTRIQGDIETELGFSAPLPIGSVAAGAHGEGTVRLSYLTEVHGRDLVAHALVQAIGNLPSPFDLFALGEHLNRGPLWAVHMEADTALALHGNVQVGEAVDLLAGTSATVGIAAGGNLQRTGKLSLLVEGEPGRREPSVLVDIARQELKQEGGFVQLGLEIDPSPTLAELSPSLLRHTGNARDLLERFASLLPPSRMLAPLLSGTLDTLDLRELAEILCDDASGGRGARAMLPRLRNSLLRAADGDEDLWSDATFASAKRLVDKAAAAMDLPPRAVEAITSSLVSGLAEHLDALQRRFREIQGHVGSEVDRELTDALGDRARRRRRGLRGLAAFLFRDRDVDRPDASAASARAEDGTLALIRDYQRFLSRLGQTIERSAETKIAARLRRQSTTAQGATMRQRVRLFPGRRGAQLLFERIACGDIRRSLLMEGEQPVAGSAPPLELLGGNLRTSASIDEVSGAEIALLDFSLSGRSILDADLTIDLDQAGNIRVWVRTESSRESSGIGESRSVRAVNVFELANSRSTGRMSFSLAVSHTESRLDDREIRGFFRSLEDEHLLPAGRADAAIEALESTEDNDHGDEASGIRANARMDVWLELDTPRLLNLLQLENHHPEPRTQPLDEERIYIAGIDAMVSAYARVGSRAEHNNLMHFIRANRLGDDLTTVLVAMRSTSFRRRHRPFASSAWDTDMEQFNRLVEMSDQGIALTDLIGAMREVYLAPIGTLAGEHPARRATWTEKQFQARQRRVDRAVKTWLRGRLLDRGIRGLWSESLRPNTLAFFIALADLALAPGEVPPMLASLFVEEAGVQREIQLING